MRTVLYVQERKNCRKSESSSSKSCDGPHLTLREIERQMVEDRRADRTSTFRAKEETPEERRFRKQAVKQERQVHLIFVCNLECTSMLLQIKSKI